MMETSADAATQRPWRAAGRVVFFLAAAAFCALMAVAQGFASHDEAWFLQVVERLRSGERLYRDVYFGITPLAVYLTTAAAALLGNELLVSRGIVMACLLLGVALCDCIQRRLGLQGPVRLLTALAILVYGLNQPAPYTPVAMVFFLAAFAAALEWIHDVPGPSVIGSRVVLAGVLAGLAFAAKHNLGVYALAALALTVLFNRGPNRAATLSRLALVAAGFAAAAGLVLLPVCVQGALPQLLRYGLLQKDVYLQAGAVPYTAALQRLASAAARPASHFAVLPFEAAFLLPPLVLAALMAVLLRERERRTSAVVSAFVVAGYLVVHPRPGSTHLAYAVPVLMIGAAFAGARLLVTRPALRRCVMLAAAAWVAAGFVLQLELARRSLSGPDRTLSRLHHFRGVAVGHVDDAVRRRRLKTLAALTAGQPTFLLGANSGLYYLAAGIENPTPFDFPYRSVLGSRGEAALREDIASGRVRSVFVFAGEPVTANTPLSLRQAVEGSMVPAWRGELGVLYRKSSRP